MLKRTKQIAGKMCPTVLKCSAWVDIRRSISCTTFLNKQTTRCMNKDIKISISQDCFPWREIYIYNVFMPGVLRHSSFGCSHREFHSLHWEVTSWGHSARINILIRTKWSNKWKFHSDVDEPNFQKRTSRLLDFIISVILAGGRSAYCPCLSWKTSWNLSPVWCTSAADGSVKGEKEMLNIFNGHMIR